MSNGSELPPDIELHRVVQPAVYMMDEDRPTSACLTPRKVDHGMLSVDRGDMSTPQQSLDRFVGSAVGVFTIGHALCQQHEVLGYHDPTDRNPSHSFLDYRGLSAGQVSKRSRKLFLAGWAACGGQWSCRRP